MHAVSHTTLVKQAEHCKKDIKNIKKAQHIANQSHSNYADQLINENHSYLKLEND